MDATFGLILAIICVSLLLIIGFVGVIKTFKLNSLTKKAMDVLATLSREINAKQKRLSLTGSHGGSTYQCEYIPTTPEGVYKTSFVLRITSPCYHYFSLCKEDNQKHFASKSL